MSCQAFGLIRTAAPGASKALVAGTLRVPFAGIERDFEQVLKDTTLITQARTGSSGR
jgi:hypothetical protein